MVYLIVDQDEYPLVWRVHNVLGSIRVFEDGIVANEFMQLANKLGYGDDLRLMQFNSVIVAKNYVDSIVKEDVWLHLFSLAHGYNDKYAYNQER